MFRTLSLSLLVLCSINAWAQDNDSAVELGGTTIIGDRELPIGLYISPWRSATPEGDIDRPSRYVSVGQDPLDAEVFERQIEYYEALDAYLRSLKKD